VLPGEGVIDLLGFFRALKTIGYRDGVSPSPSAAFRRKCPPKKARASA
jgi:sugar phosphate isomerase/epimerase